MGVMELVQRYTVDFMSTERLPSDDFVNRQKYQAVITLPYTMRASFTLNDIYTVEIGFNSSRSVTSEVGDVTFMVHINMIGG